MLLLDHHIEFLFPAVFVFRLNTESKNPYKDIR